MNKKYLELTKLIRSKQNDHEILKCLSNYHENDIAVAEILVPSAMSCRYYGSPQFVLGSVSSVTISESAFTCSNQFFVVFPQFQCQRPLCEPRYHLFRLKILCDQRSSPQPVQSQQVIRSWAILTVRRILLFPVECPYLGQPAQVQEYLEKHDYVHYLFCCLPSKDREVIVSLIDYCENHLVHFFSVPNVRNYLHHRMSFNIMGNVPLPGPSPRSLKLAGEPPAEKNL